ncbi:MAG: DUF362 domain-containing protein [Patescibacteria group bacterium]
MSIVSCAKVKDKTTDIKDVFKAVAKAMKLAHWERYVKGKNIVLKVNVVWDRMYPSCTTTPMVIEGVLKVLRSSKKHKNSTITIVDTDTAAIMNADKSFKVQGIEKMVEKYNAKVVNLTHTDFKVVSFKKALVLKNLKISKVLLNADTIITMPVLKTHSYSGMTGALKNQWGCIHDLRHNHHMVLSKAIADVNNFFKGKITFAVMDALFGMDGQGPKTGNPRKVGYIFASSDRVSLDAAACSVMGLDLDTVKHIKYAQEVGIGTTKYKVVGDKLPSFKFTPADTSNIVMATEMWLRHRGPWLEKIIFDGKSPLLTIMRWSAKYYYDLWYLVIGKKNADKMMKTNFGRIWKKNYLSNI